MIRQTTTFVLIVLSFFLFCPCVWAEQDIVSEDDRFSALINQIKPSIVAVGTHYFNDKPKNQYLGTGFIIGAGKRVVTNYHVIEPVIEKEKLSCLRIFHKQFPEEGIIAKILAMDRFHDLAILEQAGDPLPGLTLSDSSKVKEGYKIAFTGYPLGLVLGLNPTTHTGIVSGISPLVSPSPSAGIIDGSLIRHLNDPYEVFQIDATAYPGNSGSPVFRASSGEVIGVVNKVFVQGKKEHAITNPSGITYAIPARFIIDLEKTITSVRQ
ncbi:MAG: serine protease [Pseudomonadota bacterium]